MLISYPIRRIFKSWEAIKLTVVAIKLTVDFPNSTFHLKVEFYHWGQILSVIFLEVIGSLHSLWVGRNSLPDT